MRIFLVRHGESVANVDPKIYHEIADHAVPLSERGKEQAVKAGEFLAGYATSSDLSNIRIWTSPYKRTRETAAGVRGAFERLAPGRILDVRENALLCEQQFGLFDGLDEEDYARHHPKEAAHYWRCVQHEGRFWARMPLGESRFDVAVRIHQAFGTFHRDADRHGIENLIITCHGVTLRAFVMQWLHLSPEWFDAEKNPKNCWVRLIEDKQDRGYIYQG